MYRHLICESIAHNFQNEKEWAQVFTYSGQAMLPQVSAVASVDKKVLKTLSSLLSPFSSFVLALKLLLVLLLAMPEALSGEAAVDLPVLSVLLSLPFYLLCLLLASVHVLVCTSAESSCYFCSLSWGLVFAAVAFSSAMFCILVSMAARQLPLGPKIHGKVSLCTLKQHPNIGTDCDRCYSCIHMCFTFIYIQSVHLTCDPYITKGIKGQVSTSVKYL